LIEIIARDISVSLDIGCDIAILCPWFTGALNHLNITHYYFRCHISYCTT